MKWDWLMVRKTYLIVGILELLLFIAYLATISHSRGDPQFGQDICLKYNP